MSLRPADLPPLPQTPGVSYVMPVLNEADHIAAAITAVLDQDYAGEKEIVLGLGPSTDGTIEIVEAIAAADPRVHVVHNPTGVIPVSINMCVAATVHPVIIRVDAHSEIPADYTATAVTVLRDTGAANVGGLMHARGRTPFQAAVARAYMSRLGLGGPSYHAGEEAQEAESAYLGVFRREVFTELGGLDPRLRRGEDWEFNLRIRRAGGLVWFDPRMHVTYWPRNSVKRLAQQFYAGGIWRAELIRTYGASNPPRYFAPPVLVLGLGVAGAYTAARLTGAHRALPPVLRALGSLSRIPAAAYGAAVLGAAARAEDCPPAERAWFCVVLPTIHLSWGTGFLKGILAGGGTSADRGRVSRASDS